jgi:excinuclease ABC subunit B
MNESAARREAYGVKEIPFGLAADFVPTGDQPQAIEKFGGRYPNREKFQTLVGVTGSGKTYTIANVIAG